MITNLPENFKIVQLKNPATTNGGWTSGYVSLKNAKKVTFLVNMTQAVGHATALTPKQATAVAGTSAKGLTNACEIWANEDTAASDALVRQTAATSYTVSADVKNKTIIFEIEPSICMDINASTPFDCVALTSADSSQATNFASVTAIIEMRYKQATPPTAVTD